MNRQEANLFLATFFAGLENTRAASTGAELRPFLDLVLSLKQNLPLSIPLLRELAGLITNRDQNLSNDAKRETGVIKRRIDRRYRRLCRMQEELGRLDFRKAAPGISPEDYIFSRIDFSRYRTMNKNEFEHLFPEGIADFGDAFFKKNFGLAEKEIQSLIERSYERTDRTYTLQQADAGKNRLILSIMRTLETSLETLPLFSSEEIKEETENLLGFVGARQQFIPGKELLYPLLVSGLDNVLITHEDGLETKLFISSTGDLSGTFRPGGKPWTVILISVCL